MKTPSQNPTKMPILVITFIGSHRFGFYKDCRRSKRRLSESLDPFRTPLITFTLGDLLRILKPFNSSIFYLFTRYGVGAWFWKPIIIKHALSVYQPEYLIYVDSDCAFNRNPSDLVEVALSDSNLAFFSQKNKLEHFISSRAIRILKLTNSQLKGSALVTAGIVMVRNNQDSYRGMMAWERAMQDPRLLLHPFFSSNRIKHLHDQSILSSLIAKKQIQCSLVDSGFYSMGVESTSEKLENSWIYTGDITQQEYSPSFYQRVVLITDYYSRRFYDFVKTLLITPVHLSFYLLEKSIFSGTVKID